MSVSRLKSSTASSSSSPNTLLLRLALTTRMMNYASSVAKPSGGGLDLDRFRRDIEDLIRELKKNADRFIAETKEAIAAAEHGDEET
jgi:hypothetical protein